MYKSIFSPAVFDGIEEPRLLLEYFGNITGIFVDVGANFPDTSISTPLENLGWSGIVIEPQPDCAAALRLARKCPVIEAACVAKQEVENEVVKLWLAGPQSSLDFSFITPRERKNEYVSVPTKTLTSALIENNILSIDLLSLDTEGTEIEVMKGLDWNKFPPKLVILEDHGRDFKKHNFMKGLGYIRFRRVGFNSWYAKPEHALSISLYGNAQIFVKYVLGLPFRHFRRWRHSVFRAPTERV